MTKHETAIRKLALSAVLLAIPFSPAFAQDAVAIADRVKAMAAEQGVGVSWTNVTGDASNMVLEGVSLKWEGDTEALPIGNVTLTGVSENNGGYSIATLTTSPFSKSEDGVSVDLSPLVVSGLTIPPEGAIDPMSAMTMYKSIKLASMTVKIADKTAFALQGLGSEVTPAESGKPMAFTGAAEKFSMDLTLVDDPQAKLFIDALGYQNLTGYFEMAGSWQPADGRWSLTQNDISIENAGKVGMTLDLGGLTPEIVKSIRDLSTGMAEALGDADSSADEMAMLGLMQQMTFNSAAIRFDDASLTSRTINLVATQQGQNPADIVNLAKVAVPFALMELNAPELANEISNSVSAYLDNPQSLEIAAAPATPVPFATIAAIASASSEDTGKVTNALWTILGIKITANQK